MKERFTDQARIDKDHDKMLALRYQGDIQDYLARIQELNSRVDLSGRALRKIIKTQLTPEMHAAIYNKCGCIPTDEATLIKTVREIGLIQEEILRTAHEAKGSLRKSVNKSTTDMEAVPCKETERLSGERKAAKAKDNGRKGPAEEPAAMGGDKPCKDFSHLRLCWENAGQALKGVDQASIDKWKAANKSCIRCGGDNHQSVHCHRKKNIDGQKLPPAPEPTGSTGTSSTADESINTAKKRPAEDSESEPDSENEPRTTTGRASQAKRAKTAAAQRKIWAIEESDTDASMSDF